MSNVINSINDFNFDELTLGNTQSMQGGGYFTRLLFNDLPFILQTPKCYTKKGICKTGKKIYCDLKYSILEKNEYNFVEWLEKVEEKTQDLIFDNRNDWFVEAPTREDLEYMWNSCIRTFKSDYRLVRTFVQKPRQLHKGPTITVYDENENIKSIDDITKDSRMITIVEILGVKWTSQSAQLDVCLRQAMLLEDKPLFTQCLINNNFRNSSEENSTPLDVEKEHIPTLNDTLALEDSEENETHTDSNSTKKKVVPEPDSIQQSTNLFLDIKEKDDKTTESKNNTVIVDLSSNIVETVDNKDSSQVHNDVLQKTESDVAEQTNEQNKSDESQKQDISENNQNNLEKANSEEIENNVITIDLEPLEKKPEELHEVDIKLDNVNDSISLKNPNEVYIEIYKEAKKRARQAKKLAIEAYLEAKRIKSVYLLDEFDSDSDSDPQYDDEDLVLSEEQ
jgi:hypothetical protein